MYRFQGWEPIIVLLIILLVFGPGRIVKLAKDLGNSISAFRSGLKNDEQPNPQETHDSDPKPQ
mgnify:CR=1 FL=1